MYIQLNNFNFFLVNLNYISLKTNQQINFFVIDQISSMLFQIYIIIICIYNTTILSSSVYCTLIRKKELKYYAHISHRLEACLENNLHTLLLNIYILFITL